MRDCKNCIYYEKEICKADNHKVHHSDTAFSCRLFKFKEKET